MKKNILKTIPLLIIIAALAFLYMKRVKEAEIRSKIPPKEIKPVKVNVQEVSVGTVNKSIFAAGTVRAVNRHLLYFEAKGKNVSILQKDGKEIRIGSRVKKGDLLASLDVRDLEEEIKSVRAQIKHLESLFKQYSEDVKKYEELFKNGAIALQKLEQKKLDANKANADLVNAQSSLNKSLLTLEKSSIKAPADGIIAYMNIKVGDYINGAPTGSESEQLKSSPFVLLEDQLMELTVKVPSFNSTKIKPGLKARIFPVIIPPEYYDRVNDARNELKPMEKFGKIIEAEVYSISPSVDENSRSVEVKVRTTEENSFQDGLQLSCQIIVESESSQPVVPMKAVSFENRRPYCFVMEEKKEDGKTVYIASRRSLDFGVGTAEKASVKEGIKQGDLLIIEGKHNLVNGTLIETVK